MHNEKIEEHINLKFLIKLRKCTNESFRFLTNVPVYEDAIIISRH